MTRSITQRIATLGLAAVAVSVIGGTVSSAGDEATTCRTWHARISVSSRPQHTWNSDLVNDHPQHTWNSDAVNDHPQHTWNSDAVNDHPQHTWNSDAVNDRPQHTWNSAGDHSDACLSPSPTTP